MKDDLKVEKAKKAPLKKETVKNLKVRTHVRGGLGATAAVCSGCHCAHSAGS